MNHIRRVVLLSMVLALIGALVISSVALAGSGGSHAGAAAYSRSGNTYGPGDGSGPIGGGQFGPGPSGPKGPKCIDLNQNGICDCLEK